MTGTYAIMLLGTAPPSGEGVAALLSRAVSAVGCGRGFSGDAVLAWRAGFFCPAGSVEPTGSSRWKNATKTMAARERTISAVSGSAGEGR